MRFINKFQKTGTLLLVTHDTNAITTFCQNALWLHRGLEKNYGPSKNIAEQYLEATYAEKQGVVLFQNKEKSNKKLFEAKIISNDEVDQRREFINKTNLRNDIQILDFNPDASGFGAGGAKIENVVLTDLTSGLPLAYSVGGELVSLNVEVDVQQPIKSPIIGFLLKNHHGQVLFGDNTYLTYIDSPVETFPGETLRARFQFRMPILPAGDYAVTVAIASGTQIEHVQHHWMHDALVFSSKSSSVCTGLIGIPMHKIEITAKNNSQ